MTLCWDRWVAILRGFASKANLVTCVDAGHSNRSRLPTIPWTMPANLDHWCGRAGPQSMSMKVLPFHVEINPRHSRLSMAQRYSRPFEDACRPS